MTNEEHLALMDQLTPLALGEISGGEAQRIREHLQTCSTCSREYQEVSEGLQLLALSATGPAAPARSRSRLMAEAGIRTQPSAPASTPAVESREHMPNREVPGYVPMRRPWWMFVPAFAAVVLGAFSILLWTNNAHLRDELQAERDRARQTESELDQVRLFQEAMSSPQVHRVTLVSTQHRPQPEATAMYLPARHAVIMMVHNFPAPPAGKAYQLWLIPASGAAPMPLKTFMPDQSGTAMMIQSDLAETPEAKTFAVTIEPPEGSPKPTSAIVFSGA
jgi:anti-sigma factor RsiW